MKNKLILMIALCFDMQSAYGAEPDPKQNQNPILNAAIARYFDFDSLLSNDPIVLGDELKDKTLRHLGKIDSVYDPILRADYRHVYSAHCVRVKDYQEWKTTKLNPEKEIIYGNFTAFQKDRNFGRAIGNVESVINGYRWIKEALEKQELNRALRFLTYISSEYKQVQEAFPLITDGQNHTDAEDALLLAESMVKEAEELVKATRK